MTAAEPGPGWVRGERPGAPLLLTLDAGGERWTLDGRPLHAGDGLDLLTEGASCWCGRCDGEGRVIDESTRPGGVPGVHDYDNPARTERCGGCGGRGYLFEPLWLPVRFEYRNAGDGTGEAFLYPRLFGGGGEERHAIRVRKGDALRCRQRVAENG